MGLTNTVVIYITELIKAVKSYMIQAPVTCSIKQLRIHCTTKGEISQ